MLDIEELLSIQVCAGAGIPEDLGLCIQSIPYEARETKGIWADDQREKEKYQAGISLTDTAPGRQRGHIFVAVD
jgi:hypothetical protein